MGVAGGKVARGKKKQSDWLTTHGDNNTLYSLISHTTYHQVVYKQLQHTPSSVHCIRPL